jgi:peptidoglycan/xylan/chitin deacetylase (PgdA/CDA1 family)
MYHGVVSRIQDPELDRWAITQAEFARHVDFLTRSYEVLSLTEAVKTVEEGHPLRDTVVLVFDDAFANVYRNARPLLRERRLPYCVAAPAGLVGTSRTVWSLEVLLLLLRAAVPVVRLPLRNGTEDLPLTTRQQRLAAARAFLDDTLRADPETVRRSRMQTLSEQLPAGTCDRLMEEFGELKLLSAEQLRELHTEGVTIAAHGSLHAPLPENEATEVLEREIAGAKAALEAMLHTPAHYFVYTYGVYCPEAIRMVRASGYRAAFTTHHGALGPKLDPFALPRVAAECPVAHLSHQFARLSAQRGPWKTAR